MIDAPHPLEFFAKLRWLDGRPLLDTIEEYRRAIFETVLYFNIDEVNRTGLGPTVAPTPIGADIETGGATP
jgi:hypothetical protein